MMLQNLLSTHLVLSVFLYPGLYQIILLVTYRSMRWDYIIVPCITKKHIYSFITGRQLFQQNAIFYSRSKIH